MGRFDNPISRFAQLWDDKKDSPIPANNDAEGLHGDLSFWSHLRLFPPLLLLWEEWNGAFLNEVEPWSRKFLCEKLLCRLFEDLSECLL